VDSAGVEAKRCAVRGFDVAYRYEAGISARKKSSAEIGV
jgi:hypothetical protein